MYYIILKVIQLLLAELGVAAAKWKVGVAPSLSSCFCLHNAEHDKLVVDLSVCLPACLPHSQTLILPVA
jgi:hypothetical protein